MNEVNIRQTGDGHFAVEGELSKFTVPSIVRHADRIVKSATQNIMIDLQAVTRTDSAGLALLLEWMSLAHQKQLQIHFRNLPAQLLKIAEVSDLDEILPLAN